MRPAPQRGTARVPSRGAFNSLVSSIMSATIRHSMRLRPLHARLLDITGTRRLNRPLLRELPALLAAVSGAARALPLPRVVINCCTRYRATLRRRTGTRDVRTSQLSFPAVDDRLCAARISLGVAPARHGRRQPRSGLLICQSPPAAAPPQYAGIHFSPTPRLTGELPFRNEDGINTPGNLSGNIHFGGFNSAVAGGKSLGHSRRAQRPPGYRGHRRRIPAPHHADDASFCP